MPTFLDIGIDAINIDQNQKRGGIISAILISTSCIVLQYLGYVFKLVAKLAHF